MQWTHEQEQAINIKDKNILVSAAAGSGKTAVLVERIIKLMLDETEPVDIDKFLIVTFTKAAACEMKERIVDALFKRLEEMPENEHLLRQLTLLNRAQITTIHSFCLDIIKSNSHLLRLPSNFRVGDEAEVSLIMLDTIQKLFEEEYKNVSNEEFHRFIKTFSNDRDDKEAQDVIIRLYGNVKQISTQPYKWLETVIGSYNINKDLNIDENPIINIIKKLLRAELSSKIKLIDNIISMSDSYEMTSYITFFYEEKEKIEELKIGLEKGVEAFYTKLLDLSFDRLPTLKGDINEEVKKKIQENREEVKEFIKKIKTKIFIVSPREMLNSIKYMYPILKELLRLVVKLDSAFKDAKLKRGLVDFSDIEHYSLQILTNNKDQSTDRLRDKYKYIFIDEYQDINIIQDTILKLISKVNPCYSNVFMVGDVKQSIYKFRNAKPEIFLEQYNKFSKQLDKNGTAINFTQNFRSRDIIINFVNYIFKSLMSIDTCGIEYDDRAQLNLGANFSFFDGNISDKVDIDLLIRREKDEDIDDESLSEMSKAEFEARHVAERITTIVNYEPLYIYDKKISTYRKAEYSDIVILLRSTQNYLEEYLKVFMEYGIPVYSDEDKGYFNSTEIELILNILRIIDNPMQDVPLVAVLKSPVFKISLDELIEIRLKSKQSYYYKALDCYLNESDNEKLAIKLKLFKESLNRWRKYSEYMGVKKLIEKLYDELNIYDLQLNSGKSKLAKANLRLLITKAEVFEKTAFKGLFDFIRFIDKLIENKQDTGNAKVIGENENVVKIMTIHKSKGLEFPIVFLCGTSKKFNTNASLKESIILNETYGIGIDYYNTDTNVIYKLLPKYLIEQEIRKESISEEIRVLYVALTRAKEKLYIVGVIDDYDKLVNSESDSENPIDVMECKNYIEMIIPSIVKAERVNNNTKLRKNVIFEKDIERENYKEAINNKISTKIEGKYNNIEKGFIQKEYEYPTKISVSDIKQEKLLEIENHKRYPNTIEHLSNENELIKYTGADIGTIVHRILKHINFKEIKSIENLNYWLLYIKEKGIISKEEIEIVDKDKLFKFFLSDITERINNSKTVKKETPFVLEKNISELYSSQSTSEEKVLIQGIIDCYFEEDDEIVLIDYKTDFTNDITGKELVNKYISQLELYKEAIEKSLKKRVKDTFIYSIHLGKAYKI